MNFIKDKWKNKKDFLKKAAIVVTFGVASIVGISIIPVVTIPVIGGFAAYKGFKYISKKIKTKLEKIKKDSITGEVTYTEDEIFKENVSQQSKNLNNNDITVQEVKDLILDEAVETTHTEDDNFKENVSQQNKNLNNNDITVQDVKALTLDEADNLCRNYGWNLIEDSEKLDIFFEEVFLLFEKYNCLNQLYPIMLILVRFTVTKALDEHQNSINLRDLIKNLDYCITDNLGIDQGDLSEAKSRMWSRFRNVKKTIKKEGPSLNYALT